MWGRIFFSSAVYKDRAFYLFPWNVFKFIFSIMVKEIIPAFFIEAPCVYVLFRFHRSEWRACFAREITYMKNLFYVNRSSRSFFEKAGKFLCEWKNFKNSPSSSSVSVSHFKIRIFFLLNHKLLALHFLRPLQHLSSFTMDIKLHVSCFLSSISEHVLTSSL